MSNLITIANLPTSRAGNIFATTKTGERYTFASQDIAKAAKVGDMCYWIDVISDSTYKRENGNVVMENGQPVLVKRDAPVTFKQITQVFKSKEEAFRASNEDKLNALAEKVFLKKEIAALGDLEGLEADEIKAVLAMA
jgi:hypothetical protein